MTELKVKKAKKGFLDGYKTYNPEVEGYGNPEQWKHAFNQRMGYEEAVECLREDDPYVILGINKNATSDEIKKAYRNMIKKYHPDVYKEADAHERSQKIIAAYSILTQ